MYRQTLKLLGDHVGTLQKVSKVLNKTSIIFPIDWDQSAANANVVSQDGPPMYSSMYIIGERAQRRAHIHPEWCPSTK